VSEFDVPLESILECFQGVLPAPVATCAADGMPNITYMSLVHYLDRDRVALSRQYFRKTAANLDENPTAQVLVTHAHTMAQYLLDLEHLHTENAGALFDDVARQLEAIAAHTGVTATARLRGVDIFRVLSCGLLGDRTDPVPFRSTHDQMRPLDEFVARVTAAVNRDDVVREIRASLADLFGITHCIVLAAEDGRLHTVGNESNSPGVDEVEVDIRGDPGVIGVAARRRQVVFVANVPRAGVMVSAETRRPRTEPARAVRLLDPDRVRSLAAVPFGVGNELAGVLYVESEQPGFFSVRMERILRIIGGMLAGALVAVDASSASAGTDTGADFDAPLDVTYYQADDSVFADGEYVIKGVPGRILWKLLREHAADGRITFANRELRLDERLGLPAGNDNLDSRLVALRRRLASRSWGIGLERVGRGRLELTLDRPVSLVEVPTGGPMRHAHISQDLPG
jgi:adenylate cyclase